MPGFGQAPWTRKGKFIGIRTPGLGGPAGNSAIEPAASWNGTAATGFSTTPMDPARTTAKPAIRLLDRPHQYFADELMISVMAFANDGGTLIGGIDRVRVHFEGNTRDILVPTLRTFTRFDGSTYQLPCYSITLKKPDATSGNANVYFEAIPADATMQSRVIGPFQFSPHAVFPTGTLHDLELTVDTGTAIAAGVNYHSFNAAHVYIQALATAPENPLITIKTADVSGYHRITRGTFQRYAANGWLTVKADIPVLFGNAAAFTTVNAAHEGSSTNGVGSRPNLDAVLMQGSNITLETQNMVIFTEFSNEGRGWALDGVRVQNTAGIEVPWVGGPRELGAIGTGANFYTDCYISDLPSLFNGQALVRGNITEGTWFDYASGAFMIAGNVGTDHSSAEWNVEIPSITVQYTGAGTGTIALSGNRGESNRVLTAKVASSPVGTLTILRPGSDFDPARVERMQDVADWFNDTLTDWTCTVQDNSYAARFLGLTGVLHGFGDTDAKTAPIVMKARADLHGDYYQVQNGSNLENVICYGDLHTQFAGQKFFLSVSEPMKDLYFINTIIGDNTVTTGSEDRSFLFSQLGRGAQSNVVIAHCTTDQSMLVRLGDTDFDADAYCLLSSNVFGGISYEGFKAVDLVIDGNHTFTGTSGPAGSTNHTAAGTRLDLFTDIAAGNFNPAGALLTNLKSRKVERLIGGGVRSGTAPAGAGPAIAINFAALPAPVLPAAAAPTFASSSITGTPENGQVLTANHTIGIGFPLPTVAYQWQKGGVNISGQTAVTITLNAATMSLVNADTISCEITLTNASGSVTAEPTRTYSSGLGPSLYTTANMGKIGPAANVDFIDADSFRAGRDGAGNGRAAIGGVPSGNYRIRGTLSVYDGAVAGITGFRFRIVDNFTSRFDTFNGGAFDRTVSITSGTLGFDGSSTGSGFRLDDFHIEAV